MKNIVKVLIAASTSVSFAQPEPATPAIPPAPSATEKETDMKSDTHVRFLRRIKMGKV